MLRDTTLHFSTAVLGHFKQQNQPQKCKKKKSYLIHCGEDSCLQYELKQEGGAQPSSPQLGTHMSGNSKSSAMSANDDESIDLRSQISVSKGPDQPSPPGTNSCPAQPLWVGTVWFGRSQQMEPLCEGTEPGTGERLQ